jgi:hypothetical protein
MPGRAGERTRQAQTSRWEVILKLSAFHGKKVMPHDSSISHADSFDSRRVFVKYRESEIVATNYWDSPPSQNGWLCFSIVGNGFHLLIPTNRSSCVNIIHELQNPCISRATISKGEQFGQVGYELVLVDGSKNPYRMQLSQQLTLGTVFSIPFGKNPLTFSAWEAGCRKIMEMPIWFRRVKKLSLNPGGVVQIAQVDHHTYPWEISGPDRP